MAVIRNITGEIWYREAETGYRAENSEGFKESHVFHRIVRNPGEGYGELWDRMSGHLMSLDGLPGEIDGVHVIAAVDGFLVTLCPDSLWPVLHPYEREGKE